VFVRDRGAGFDLGAVASDRHGVRSSIVDRMERHGGRADVRSAPGEGTEVRLHMTRHAQHQTQHQTQPQPHAQPGAQPGAQAPDEETR
jgi:signal transduction histidine kinase